MKNKINFAPNEPTEQQYSMYTYNRTTVLTLSMSSSVATSASIWINVVSGEHVNHRMCRCNQNVNIVVAWISKSYPDTAMLFSDWLFGSYIFYLISWCQCCQPSNFVAKFSNFSHYPSNFFFQKHLATSLAIFLHLFGNFLATFDKLLKRLKGTQFPSKLHKMSKPKMHSSTHITWIKLAAIYTCSIW